MGSNASAILAAYSAGTYGTVSAAVKEYWVRQLLTALYPDLPMIDLCRESGPNAWRQIPVRNGSIVHFARLPVLSAVTSSVNEGDDDPAATTADLTGVTAQVAMYPDWVKIGDESKDMAMSDPVGYLGEALAYGAIRTLNGLIYTEAKSSGTTAATEDGDSAASTVLTAEANHGCTRQNLEYMAYKLKSSNVRTYPTGSAAGTYQYIAHPYGVKSLRAVTAEGGYVDIAKNLGQQEVLRENVVGRVAGFTVKETTEVTTATVSAATSAAAYQQLAVGYEGIGCVSLAGNATRVPRRGTGRLMNKPHQKFRSNVELIIKPVDSGGASNPLNRRGSVGYKLRTVAKVLDSDRVYVHLVYGGTFT